MSFLRNGLLELRFAGHADGGLHEDDHVVGGRGLGGCGLDGSGVDDHGAAAGDGDVAGVFLLEVDRFGGFVVDGVGEVGAIDEDGGEDHVVEIG